MNHATRIAALCGLCLLACEARGLAAEYVWQEDGGWTAAPEPDPGTPAGRLAGIRADLERGRNRRAIQAVEQLLREHPDAPQAEEAMHLAGRAAMQRGRYYDAYEWFERQLRSYPDGQLADRALVREMEIAEAFLQGRKRVVLGFLRLPARAEGVEILRRVAEHAPGSELADRALLRIGDYHFERGEYVQAVDAYDEYRVLFGQGERASHAALQAARAVFRSFKGLAWDVTPLVEAEQRLRAFRQRWPLRAREADVGALLARIDQLRAEKLLQTAGFYRRVSRPRAARFYCRQVARAYPDSDAADRARAVMERLEPREPPARVRTGAETGSESEGEE